MCCVPAVHRGEKEGDQNLSISSPYNKYFLLRHHFPIQYITHSPTSSISVPHNSLYTFSQEQCHLTLLAHSSIFLQPLPYPPYTLFHIPPATTLPSLHTLPYSSSHYLTLLAHSSIFLQPLPYPPCTFFHIPPATTLPSLHTLPYSSSHYLTLLTHSSIFLQPLPYPPCTLFHIPPATTILLTSSANTH